MATYYEVLKVQPTASSLEIEAACDALYHHWRRLVTHHDPTVVNKANQALQILEKIRTTLTNPAKRTAYDATLGVLGSIGGLAAPQQARAPAVAPIPRRPVVAAPQIPDDAPHAPARMDAWICPQCGTTNPVKSRFCKKCGQTLGVNCPKCNTIIEATNIFCAVCGGNIQQLTEQKQRRSELIDAQQQLTAKRVEVASAIPDSKDEVKAMKRVAVSAIAWIGWVSMWLSIALQEIHETRCSTFFDDQAVYNCQERFSGFLIAGLFGLLLTLVGIIALRKLTFSAVVISVLSVLLVLASYGDVLTYGIPLYFLNVLWFGGKLTKRSPWVWGLVAAILASGIWSLLIFEAMYWSGNLTVNVFWVVLSVVTQIIVLSIIALRAWALSRHLKLEEETIILTSQSTLERIDHELQQLTQELTLLDVRY